MNDERRICKRVNVRLDSMYRLEDAQESSTCVTVNISAIGVCLETKEELKDNASIEVKIFLDTGDYVTLKGEVVWNSPMWDRQLYLIGVKIYDANEGHQELFERYYKLKSNYSDS